MEGICYLKIGHLIWKCGGEFFCYCKNYVFPERAIIKREKCNYLGLFLCSGIFRTPYKHLPRGAHCSWHARENQAVHRKCNWQLDKMSGLVDVRKSPGAEARCVLSLWKHSFFFPFSHWKLNIFPLLTLDICQYSYFCPNSLLDSRLLEVQQWTGLMFAKGRMCHRAVEW